MRRMRMQDEQGGATVELALMSTLFVPMVIYAIYVGEAYVAGIKAQSAEIAAGWEVTAYLLHDYRNGNPASLYDNALSRSANRAQESHKDFDSFDDTGRTGYLGVFGFDRLEYVRCQRRDISNFGPDVHGTKYLKKDFGWIGCEAETTFENRRATTDAHREMWHGRPKIIQDSFKRMRMCGSGETLKGCQPADGQRGFVVMTDDWGLENPAKVEVGSSGPNQEYYKVGADMFGGLATTTAQAALVSTFGFLVGALDQGATDTFKMGYMETIRTKRRFPSHGGSQSLHLSIDHEQASPANNQDANLSDKTYDDRHQTNYMGMQDPDWNLQ